MLSEYITLFWKLCCFKVKPQDMPYSVSLLAILIAINALMRGFAHTYLVDNTLASAVPLVLVVITTIIGFSLLVLHLRGKFERWLQVLIAIFASNSFINLMAAPLLLAPPLVFALQGSTALLIAFRYLYVFIMLAVSAWLLAVVAHIYRYALEVSFAMGLLVSVGLLGTHILIHSYFF